jgi:RecA/RadA recombinase
MEEKQLNSFIKSIRKTTDSQSFESSSYGDVTEWIDTGDYALNRIISGDIYKGIPAGKVIALAGESQTGKSFIAAQIAANALKQGYHHVFYFDSEGGAMKGFFEGRGCDISKIEHILVSSVQDAAVNILGVYAKILEFKKENPEYKALMILDSLGACVNAKFLNDAANGRVASEMGGRAKIVNDMMKSLTTPALKSGTSIIVVNHVYDDPSSMFGSTIKAMGGGKGFLYMARVVLQCSRSFEQSDNRDKQAYKATVLKFMTTKNALVKPFYKSEVYLDFEEGTNRYFGLLKPAIEYGFIQNPSKGFYTVPSYSDKKMRLKEIMDTPEIWETFLDDFNEKSKTEMAYSGTGGQEIEEDELEELVDQFIEEDHIED